MFSKELRTNRRGQQIRKAKANLKLRKPENRKIATEAHQDRVSKRGKIASKRARTAERDATYDLIDLINHHMSMVWSIRFTGLWHSV